MGAEDMAAANLCDLRRNPPTSLLPRGRALWGLAVLGATVAVAMLLISPGGATRAAGPAAAPTAPQWKDLTGKLLVAPPALTGAGFAWDVRDHYGVLFGGANGLVPAANATWTFNGHWHNLTGSAGTAPSARIVHAMMVYDAADGYVLLFGGNAANGNGLGDTWSFSAGRWTNLTPLLAVAPPARGLSGMTYDPALGAVLLFGGSTAVYIAAGTFYNDTWSYSHGTWTQLNTTIAPSLRRGPQISYDPKVSAVVLMGGVAPNGRGISDTWYLTSRGWRLTGLLSPPAEWLGISVYDARLGALLLDDGCTSLGCASANGTLYAFVAGGWYDASVLYHLNVSPSTRSSSASGYDPAIGKAVLFGGATFGSGAPTPVAETWTFG